MKFLKNIFLFALGEIDCTKEDFIHAINQESKLNSYFIIMYMLCKLIIAFTASVVVLFSVIMLLLSIMIYHPIMLLPIFIIICLPYIVMLFLNYIIKKEKENENKN